jgi:DNA-binding FrmR family transcriptional regulator
MVSARGYRGVAHTIRDKTKLLNRVRRLRGQVEGIERLLTEEKGCTEVLMTIAACRGAIHGLMAEVIEGHIQDHLVDPAPRSVRADAARELMDVVKAYLR